MYARSQIDLLKTALPSKRNESIDEILRGEIAAVEAYERVIVSLESDPEVYRLKLFKLDHENAVQYWKRQAVVSRKTPQGSSEIWGLVVDAFMGISSLIGEEAALRALKKGELHGIAIYERMLESEQLTTIQKDEIRNTFIPRQQRHIQSIEKMMNAHQK